MTCFWLPWELQDSFPPSHFWYKLQVCLWLVEKPGISQGLRWFCGFWLFIFCWDDLIPNWVHTLPRLPLAFCTHGMSVWLLLQGHLPLCILARTGDAPARVLLFHKPSRALPHSQRAAFHIMFVFSQGPLHFKLNFSDCQNSLSWWVVSDLFDKLS